MQFTIRFQDDLTPFLNRAIEENPQWVGSAIKSAGYWSQKQIKAGIRSGAPGGHPYARLMPAFLRRRLDIAFGYGTRRNYNPMGKLVNAVGYDSRTWSDRNVVTVGWLSMEAVRIGSKQEKGYFTIVTERTRHIFGMAGIMLSNGKTQIAVPARPTYGPMRAIIQTGAPKQVETKLIQYMQGATKRSIARSSRAYIVYQ